MPPEIIKVSKRGRDQLIALKRRTGIDQWNVVCRWALCSSLAEPTSVPDTKVATDSNVEMSWATFAGDLGEVYWSAIRPCLQTD